MTTYYVSRYLNVYPSERGTSILFHGVTGAIDDVDSALGRWLKGQQRDGLPLSGEYSGDVLTFLSQRGHITTDAPEIELEHFKTYVAKLHAELREQRKQSGFLMLVPSYYCNLACAYCYQNPMRAAEGKSATQVMTPDIVDCVFSKVFRQLFASVTRPSQITLDLYGGEPFLARNRPALERIFTHTRDLQMSVSAISNASMLDEYLPYFGIEPGQVNSLQISFDGDKLQHDQSRITHYGGGTFDAIVANIHRLLDQGTQLNLRVNTSKTNVDSLPLLWERLTVEEITSDPRVSIYAAAIHNHFEQANPEPLFSPATLTRRIEQQGIGIRAPLARKQGRMANVVDADAGIPLNRTNFCMQNMPNAFLIDHRCDIYSCYEEAGNRQIRVGYFAESGDVEMLPRYEMYQSRHIGMVEPCSKCSVALTCGGGCPVAARGKNWATGTIFTNHCDSHRELTAIAVQRLVAQRAAGGTHAVTIVNESAQNQPCL